MSTAPKAGCTHKHSGASVNYAFGLGLVAGVLGTALAVSLARKIRCKSGCGDDGASPSRYTIANQPARFARDKAANNVRVLDIDKVFEPQHLRGKTILVTGGNRGIGLALSEAASACGARVFATCRTTNEKLSAIPNCTAIEGVDVTSDASMETLVAALEGVTIDVLINNAGYFYRNVEKLDSLNYAEESVSACGGCTCPCSRR
jgi:hypothetical protein